MTATKTRLMRCTEPHVCVLEVEDGLREFAFKRGDELPADHAAPAAHPIYWTEADAPPEFSGVAVEPEHSEPEPEPLPPGAVRMRTRESTRKKRTSFQYRDVAGKWRDASGGREIIVTEQTAAQLEGQSLAERI